MLWDDGDIGVRVVGAILVVVGIYTVWPVVPAIIAGWACGKKLRGVSIGGGLAAGVACGIVVALLQPKVLTWIRWDLDVYIYNWMYLFTPAASILLTVALCLLWVLTARRLGSV